MRTLTLQAALALFFTVPALAQDTNATYDLRIIGLKIGEVVIKGRVANGRYNAQSNMRTTGATGILARARFTAQSKGRVTSRGFEPASYTEDVHTGRRESSARLAFKNRIPRVTGGTLAAKEGRIDPAREKGALDPMTALFAALRDQPRTGLCKLSVTTFDGARAASLRMTPHASNDARVICKGNYTRLRGFSERELKRQTVFPFQITYEPKGDVMQATRMEIQSSYGKAVLTRR